jgi:hypothetical protein
VFVPFEGAPDLSNRIWGKRLYVPLTIPVSFPVSFLYHTGIFVFCQIKKSDCPAPLSGQSMDLEFNHSIR